MFALGSLQLSKELVISGHPGLSAKRYRFPVQPGRYTAYVAEQDGPVSRVVLVQGNPEQAKATERIRWNMINENHGGILLAESSDIDALPEDIEDEDLHNYFADGLMLRSPTSIGSWKSNSDDGNIIFVPSYEYYVVSRLSSAMPGFEMLCGTDWID